jgi:DNA-binding MarR family transcriptional regulator
MLLSIRARTRASTRMLRRHTRDARPNARLPGMVIHYYNMRGSHWRSMKRTYNSRVPRPGVVARVAGIDYADLDEHFGYALKRAQIAAFAAYSRAAAGDDITPPRYTALVIIERNPGISQTTLGEVLGTARSGAMMLTDWLEQRGLAERRHRANDGRAWGLFLTAKGTALVRRLNRKVGRHDRQFATRLAARERKELLRLLAKLTD